MNKFALWSSGNGTEMLLWLSQCFAAGSLCLVFCTKNDTQLALLQYFPLLIGVDYDEHRTSISNRGRIDRAHRLWLDLPSILYITMYIHSHKNIRGTSSIDHLPA